MNTQFKATFTSILLAITIAATSAIVEAGKGDGGQSGSGAGSGNGVMYGPGPTTGNGYQAGNSNQYRYRHQHQSVNGNGGNAKRTMQNFDSGKDQYSNDKYLNQKDFQAWLNQNPDQVKTQTRTKEQYQDRYQVVQDGL